MSLCHVSACICRCSSDMIAAGTTSTNCTARNSSSRTVYFRQGRFFVISITQRTSHGLIFTRYYTSGRFEVKEDLQWVNRPVEAAHSAGDSCGDAASKAASGGGAEGLQEGCSEAHTAGEESSADERGCHADEILEDGNGRTLHDVLKPPTHQQPRRQMPDPRLYSRYAWPTWTA